MRQLDQGARALELEPRDQLGLRVRNRASPRARQMLERAGRVPLLDQRLSRLQLERGDAMGIEAEPLRRLDALLEILERRKVAVGPEEDLGEIFE